MMITTTMTTKYSHDHHDHQQQSTPDTIMNELIELTNFMQRSNVDVASSQDYCQAVTKDIHSHQHHKQRNEHNRKHGPRGVEDLP
jgi:hypothetical protein